MIDLMFTWLNKFFKTDTSTPRMRTRAEILADIKALPRTDGLLDETCEARFQALSEEYIPYFREDQKLLAKLLEHVKTVRQRFSDSELIDIANEAEVLAVGAYSLVYDICEKKTLANRDELNLEMLNYHADAFKLYGYEECDIPKFLRIRSLSEFQLYIKEFVGEGLSVSQIVDKFQAEIKDFADIVRKPALHNLGFNPRKEDYFWAYIHPQVKTVSRVAFKSGLYADAVESAFKEINTVVKEKVRPKIKKELDGQKLMQHVFAHENPILLVEDDLVTQTNRDSQQGYMMMFAGAMSAIRNPKAHENMTISKEDAVRKLMFASMLMYKLDSTHFTDTTNH